MRNSTLLLKYCALICCTLISSQLASQVCLTTINSYPYKESFESGLGGWTQDLNGVADDYDWTRDQNGTPSSGTGPSKASTGSWYLFTEASGVYNKRHNLQSPCFNLTGTTNPRFVFYYHMYGADTGTINVHVSTNNGTSYPTLLWTNNKEVQKANASSWIPVSIDLSSYVGSTIKIRIQGITGSNYRSDMAIDNISLITKPNPTTAPGGVTSSLQLWLKGNSGLSYSNGQAVSLWSDKGKGGDAYVNTAGQEPTYWDNATKNINFNPVVDFNNSYNPVPLDGNFTHDDTSTKFLEGASGFYSQDIFMVLIPDVTVNSSFGSMDVFCGDEHNTTNETDATGIGLGAYTARFSNEVLCYAVGTTSGGNGYGVAQTGTGISYNNAGIINTRNNTATNRQELYYNALNKETNQNDVSDFSNVNNSRYWIGRSEGWEASTDARIAEIITYSSRKADANLTQERNRIQSYLAIKYGITLGNNGTSQNYVDSSGNVIWNQSANSGYNYDITGIGRDDASALLQKQSRSVNNASDAFGRTQGILTIGLTDIYTTNNQNISNNPTTFGLDRQYLVWGNNGANLNSAATTITVNMSAGISPALTTNVSFTAMQRVWKVVENRNGGDIPKVKISIPQNAIRNISPPGSYYMFISSTGVFDPTADYRLMTPDGNGNLTTEYDFDNTKYITFGYAPQIVVERSIYFDGAADYIDMENKLNLNPAGFTISAWIKRDTGSTNVSIVSKRDAAFTKGYDFKINNTGKLQIYWRNGSNQTLLANTTIPENEWHHVAAIYDGTKIYLYIDGVLDKSANRTPPVDTDESFYIAAAGKLTPTQYFKGNIDEVRVWNTDLSVDQLRYIMNQEIENNSSFVRGKVLPNTVTKNEVASIPWNKLSGYYPMSVYTYTNTEDASGNGNQGALRNLDTVDRQTAPLPYESAQGGSWDTNTTWKNGTLQYMPGSTSIVSSTTTVDWNIVKTTHDVDMSNLTLPSGNALNRTVLALMVNSNKLTVNGSKSLQTGYGLTVTHYLSLDGTIDLDGESQLIQTTDSDFAVTSSGKLERDQQGTADKFTYNYWSSPVGVSNTTTNNNSYRVKDVMKDGVNNINWLTSGYNGTNTNPIGIADYWIWKFANLPDDSYASWQHVRSTGSMRAGEGFTMKGPGTGSILTDQNYTFNGKPNNGDINLTLNAGNDYLVGNPYPSAIDGRQFILDNGPTIAGNGNTTGTLYFWEHWGGGSHVLSEYQGGYATYNLSGGSPSASYGTNDPDVGTGGTPTKIPGRYIPVSQGFFVVKEGTGVGTINFNNGQRIFMKEGTSSSVFVRSSENSTATNYNPDGEDLRMKFRIGFNSVNTIHRQILLTIDESATEGIDWGYDAAYIDEQMDDMYWIINDEKFIIQGTNAINESTVMPLGLHLSDGGQNKISIDHLENVPDDIEIFVHDKVLNLYHNLRQSEYIFNLPAGSYLDRYEITFQDGAALGVEDNELAGLDVYYANNFESLVLVNPNIIKIKSIEMFNVIGQSVMTIKPIENSNYSEYKVKNLSAGTYIVKLITENGTTSKKVLVE
ncbi:MAG: LamG-like jellyroll fold domain-containing protein [Gelidibacter sp.]